MIYTLPMMDMVAQLFGIADGQFGYVTLAQARRTAVDKAAIGDVIDAGLAENVCPGVIRMRAGGRHPFPRIYTAWLLLEPDQFAWERPRPAAGVVSGGSALRLYKVGDLPSEHIEFCAPEPSALASIPHVVVRQADLHEGDWTDRYGLPVTSPGRTLEDIASAPSTDLADLSRIASAFLRSGVDEGELAAGIDRYLRRHGLDGDGRSWLNGLLSAADGA